MNKLTEKELIKLAEEAILKSMNAKTDFYNAYWQGYRDALDMIRRKFK